MNNEAPVSSNAPGASSPGHHRRGLGSWKRPFMGGSGGDDEGEKSNWRFEGCKKPSFVGSEAYGMLGTLYWEERNGLCANLAFRFGETFSGL